MDEGQMENKGRKQKHYEVIFLAVIPTTSSGFKPSLVRILKNRWRLSMIPWCYNNIVLGQGKFCNSLILCYVCIPPDIPTHCDGYQKEFALTHMLVCKVGG
eukprot:2195255-Ditylum_brightwellii.AAC.1